MDKEFPPFQFGTETLWDYMQRVVDHARRLEPNRTRCAAKLGIGIRTLQRTLKKIDNPGLYEASEYDCDR